MFWSGTAVVKRLTIALLILFLLLPAKFAPARAQDYQAEREKMVAHQIVARGVSDPLVIKTMTRTKRHLFVPERYWDMAYDDHPLPIGYGQTISQPYIVAYMTEALKLTGDEKVLEVGTGSGYQAAVLAGIVDQVYSVEIIDELHQSAKTALHDHGYDKVRLKSGDGYYGWDDQAPFDAIIVTCAADHVPPPLIKQLKEGGRLIIPVGPPGGIQTLLLVEKEQNGQVTRHDLLPVRFVPLTRR